LLRGELYGIFRKMNIKVENIGKITSADVTIDGITVIAGVNDTGKSTIGKALFCIFNTFYKLDETIDQERINSILFLLRNYDKSILTNHSASSKAYVLAEKAISNKKQYIENKNLLKEEYNQIFSENKNKENDDVYEGIQKILSVSEKELTITFFTRYLNTEFGNQVNNIFSDSKGKIILTIQNIPIVADIVGNEVTKISQSIQLSKQAIYIDDPFVLDEMQNVFRSRIYSGVDHRTALITNILREHTANNAINEIITEKTLQGIYNKINVACSGEINRQADSSYVYKIADNGKSLNICNISTGMKTFAILKTLLENGSLEEKGTLILDEPEIHLHPEWQLLFAEIIVLIQKDFNMHILINTHSPYFLEAIETYSKKYGVKERCRYYLAKSTENGAVIEEVTKDTAPIYAQLSGPFEKLEKEESAL